MHNNIERDNELNLKRDIVADHITIKTAQRLVLVRVNDNIGKSHRTRPILVTF
jgi:hypothetical protein